MGTGSGRERYSAATVNAAILLAALLLAAPPPAENSSTFARAYQALQSGRHREAMELFEQAESEGEGVGGWAALYFGEAAAGAGETQAALSAWQRLEFRSEPWIAFRTARDEARLRNAEGDYVGAAGRLLRHADDPIHGPEARYMAGRILLEHGDTLPAIRKLQDLVAVYPASSFAHRATLVLSDLPRETFDEIISRDNYLALAMARAAIAAEDFVTADIVLSSLTRRSIDRRLRGEILLLHGRTLFRLSRYQESISAYRESMRFATSGQDLMKARKGAVIGELYRGDTVEPLLSLHRIPATELEGEFLEDLLTMAAVRRAHGDGPTSRVILRTVARPTFEDFLATWETLFETEGTTLKESLYWNCHDRAEKLSSSFERSLAFALLAELPRTGISASVSDAWRIVLFEADDAFLLRYAAARIAKEERPEEMETEALQLLEEVLPAPGEVLTERLARRLRLIAYGYPGTSASSSARAALEHAFRDWLAAEELDFSSHSMARTTARELLAAGAFSEVEGLLVADKNPSALLLRIEAAARVRDHAKLTVLTRRLIEAAPFPVTPDELPPEYRYFSLPLAWEAEIIAAAREYGVDSSVMTSLILEESRFDPSHSGGFTLGLTALPTEVLDFAAQFPEAPRARPADLLKPETAIRMGAWFLGRLNGLLGDSVPPELRAYLLATAKHLGPGNIPDISGASSPLVLLARSAFPRERAALLRIFFGIEEYRRRLGPGVPPPPAPRAASREESPLPAPPPAKARPASSGKKKKKTSR